MPDFIPNNPLEELLVRAATDPAARPDFYRELRRSTLFVITPEAPARETTRITTQSTSVAIVEWQGPSGPFVPIFSSRERLEEIAKRTGRAIGFLGMEGAKLFEVLTQRTEAAVLNPGLPYGKDLTPDEIRRLADGSIAARAEQRVLKEKTQILLGQPAVFPQTLVDALDRLFQQRDTVEAAYVAQVLFQDGVDAPHPIVGLSSTNYTRDVADAGLVAQEARDQLPVDFVDMRAESDGVIERYLRENTKPFFERKKKPWWRVF